MSAAGVDLAAYASVHTTALKQLAVGSLNLWDKGYRAVRNFALEPRRALQSTETGKSDSEQDMTFEVHDTVSGDLVTGAFLEVRVPALQAATEDYLPTYVWGLGFALVARVQVEMGGDLVEETYGDYFEMAQELHSPAGRTFESVFKLDRVTLPELSELSTRSVASDDTCMVLYVPLRVFFARSAQCHLPLVLLKKLGVRTQIRIVFRSLRDLAFDLPTLTGITSIGLPNCKRTGTPLSYSHFRFRLWVNTVLLEEDEARAIVAPDGSGKMGYSALVTTVQSLNSNTAGPFEDFEGNLVQKPQFQFRHPVKLLMWAIRDKKATGEDARTGLHATSADPFSTEVSVRSLHGARAQVLGAVTVGDAAAQAAGTKANKEDCDWNVHRVGSVAMNVAGADSGDVASNAAGVGLTSTSKDVKQWRADGLGGCIHLPGNRFDYRAVSAAGQETEPLNSIVLKLANQPRWNQELASSSQYFRHVQMQHCARQARKGIHAYSFAVSASAAVPTGSANFTKIYSKDLQVTKNSPASTASSLVMFAENHNIFVVSGTAGAGSAGMLHRC